MSARAREGACLAALVRMAIPLCQEAEQQCLRTGPGRPPDFPDWLVVTLIMVAVLAKKKSKSAQPGAVPKPKARACLDPRR